MALMVSRWIDALEWSIVSIHRWIVPLIWILGILGNLLNLLVFASRTFRRQSSSLYLMSISVNNVAMFAIGLSTRILDEGFQLRLFGDTSDVYCKMRTFLVYSLFAISNWLLVCASLDRFFSTSSSALTRQRFCSTRMASRFIGVTVAVCLFAHSHLLVFYHYSFKFDLSDPLSSSCTVNNAGYHLFFAFFILVFYSLLPPLLMGLIGTLTLNHIRKSRRHLHPFFIPTALKRCDRTQLIKILSIQIGLLMVCTIPHTSYWIYVAFTFQRSALKSTVTREYEKFFLHLVRILLYINYGSSFYVQMFVSKAFRAELVKALVEVRRRCRRFL